MTWQCLHGRSIRLPQPDPVPLCLPASESLIDSRIHSQECSISRMNNFRTPRAQRDIELGQPPPNININGFPSVSTFIAGDPDHSFSIYPAFHKLSSRNLLYLEAELWELQREQDVMDIQDARTGDPDFFRSWKKLSTSRDPRQMQRVDLIGRIRSKLKEYRKCFNLDNRRGDREC